MIGGSPAPEPSPADKLKNVIEEGIDDLKAYFDKLAEEGERQLEQWTNSRPTAGDMHALIEHQRRE